jgi:GT2 family glycosyltransferase
MTNEKPKTIVFCLPGNQVSSKFLECWSALLLYCVFNNIRPVLSLRQSCNIYYVRNMCLGADVLAGKNQEPFQGKIDYDYIMWIDSDILFTPTNFEALLKHDLDIVSGLYHMEDGKSYAAYRFWDEGYFKKHGCFEPLTAETIAAQKAPFAVDYAGMGFMLVKKGVFEKMEYPWFRPIEKKIGRAVDFTMEDVSFCLTARKLGFGILVDPNVLVGHEKKVVL